MILAAASNVTITVAHNLIANNAIGIWVAEVLPGVTITAPGPNQYVNVAQDVVTVTPAS